MQEDIFSDKYFKQFCLMIAFVLVVSSPFLWFSKETISIWLNAWHTPFLDHFFYYITYLGDGLVFVPVLIFLLFRSYSLSAFFASFVVVEAILVQLVLKKGIFAHLDRPSAYIPNFEQLHQVVGVHLHGLHTFPSGHTQSIFLVITFLALVIKKSTSINLLLVAIAIFTALSRVYLLQHFFIDIWFGALIGFGVPVLSIFLWQKKKAIPDWGRFHF